MYEHSNVSIVFHCCSILSDRSAVPKGNSMGERIAKREHYSLFTLHYYLKHGGVAQLGEHLPCKQGVMGSIPIISTIFEAKAQSALGSKIMRRMGG